MSRRGDEVITLQLIPHHETDLALLVSRTHDEPKDDWVWLPKSRISYKEDFEMGEVIDIDVPRWIVERNDLQ